MTLEQAQTMLNAYITAETNVLAGKEVRLGGPGVDRWYRMEDLQEIIKGRKEWEAKVAALTAAMQPASVRGLSTFGGVRYGLSRFNEVR